MKAEILQLALLAASVSGVATLRPRLNHTYDRAPTVVDEARVPIPPVARALCLGHVEWAADVFWVNAQIYYGEALLGRLPGRFTRAYADTIIALDPRFREGYRWAALALTSRSVEAMRQDVEDAVRYLRRGHAAFPEDSEMELDLGYTLAFELAPWHRNDASVHQRYKLEGARHMGRAVLAGWGPPWLGLTVAAAFQQGGQPAEALEYLRGALPRAEDDVLRQRIEARIATILSQAPGVDPLVRMSAEADRARRGEYPYMPSGLYLFAGPRVTEP